ncbi:MAG: FKBP-type peptidyl-prolyl cis-trans isomerase [Muribaculaceae bacterium]|nr:FKBP-type peptidyl-prolyl cis-trans isomerase [Muribaculaceae bacterium]
MKKILYAITMCAAGMMSMTSCLGNGIEDQYKDWHDANQQWLKTQQVRVGTDGKLYYEAVTAPWDPNARVLMHWHNDRSLTEGNLKPLYTSTVDVKYIGRLYNGTPFDSSYLSTSPRDSISRFSIGPSSSSNNGLIEGWAVALMNMHVGDSCTVVIDYQQGYGIYQVNNLIKPYSVLQFDLKLDDIYKYETKP